MTSLVVIDIGQFFLGAPRLPPLDISMDLYKSSVVVVQNEPTMKYVNDREQMKCI